MTLHEAQGTVRAILEGGREAAIGYAMAIPHEAQQDFAWHYLAWRVGLLDATPLPATWGLTIVCAEILLRTIDMLLFGGPERNNSRPRPSR